MEKEIQISVLPNPAEAAKNYKKIRLSRFDGNSLICTVHGKPRHRLGGLRPAGDGIRTAARKGYILRRCLQSTPEERTSPV